MPFAVVCPLCNEMVRTFRQLPSEKVNVRIGNLKAHLGLAGRHRYYLRALQPLGSMKYAQTAEIVDELRQEAALEYGKGAGRSRQVKLNFGLVSSARRYSGPVAGMIGQRISQSIYTCWPSLSWMEYRSLMRTPRHIKGRRGKPLAPCTPCINSNIVKYRSADTVRGYRE